MTNPDDAPSRSRLTFFRGLLLSLLLHGLLLWPVFAATRMPRARIAHNSAQKLQVELFGMLTDRQVQARDMALEEAPPLPPEPEPEPETVEENTLPIPAQAEKTPPSPVQVKKKEPDRPAVRPPVQRAEPRPAQPKTEGGAEARAQQTIRAPNDEDRQKIYMRDVVRRIQNRLIYPAEARRLGQMGLPSVRFTIDPEGRILPGTLVLHKSSGYSVLDRQAMQTVRDSAPFARPPKRMEIVVEISFAEKI